MNKTAIRNYAVWARTALIDAVTQKAFEYEIKDGTEMNSSLESINGRLLTLNEREWRRVLIDEIKSKGFNQVIEEVAYTWFNRFIALRYMEVNGFIPSRVRVFTNENGEFKPDILKEAMTVEIEGVDRAKVIDLLEKQNNEELFKYLIITQCNALNQGLPYMFEKISNWTELLFPSNLLRADSVIGRMVTDIPEEDWQDAVQIIGWMYQYYNTELKDDTFAKLKKNIKITKERIPAATQLFTPDWIVRYMVENSLGRLWYEGHPDDSLKANWKYYLEEAEQEPDVENELKKIRDEYANIKPEDIKIIDPCMGSGHILVYAFDVLMQIYTLCGWSERDAAKSILENNLYGLDIDYRAGQLAYFAIMMKARKHNRRILNGETRPNILAIQDSGFMSDDFIAYVAGKDMHMKADLTLLRSSLKDAKEYGSILNVPVLNYAELYERIDIISRSFAEDLFQAQYQTMAVELLLPLVKQTEIMAQKYDVVVTNPPYMGNGGMSTKLSEYLKTAYSAGKADFSAAFMEKCVDMTKVNRYSAMVTPQSWMFLVAFYRLRMELLSITNISSLIHLGTGAFDSGFGTTAFVLKKSNIANENGIFADLRSGENGKEKRTILFDKNNWIINSTDRFSKLPNCVIAYWCTKNMQMIYSENKKISEYYSLECGIKNGNNEVFLRLWHEVSLQCINISNAREECLEKMNSGKKWFKCNKGGGYRKWYGNYEYVINLENDAKDIKATIPASTYRLRKKENYFWPTITWPLVSGTRFGCRYMPIDTLPDVNANIILIKNETEYQLMGYMNSKVFDAILDMLNPTLAFPIDTVSSAPYIPCVDDRIPKLVAENITISQIDWGDYETSWDFKKHPLV